MGDDKKLLKTFNSQLSNLQKYNINNISGGKLLKQVKNHTNTYNLEVTMYVKKSYKQRDNAWTPVYAGCYSEAVTLIKKRSTQTRTNK